MTDSQDGGTITTYLTKIIGSLKSVDFSTQDSDILQAMRVLSCYMYLLHLLVILSPRHHLAFAFVAPASFASTLTALPSQREPRHHRIRFGRQKPAALSMIDPSIIIRGGATDWIVGSLRTGPQGILGLWAVSATVVIPLTLYRQAFSFSVGYGFSVMAMGIALATVFSPSPLVLASIFYGLRLGSYLTLRLIFFPAKDAEFKSYDKTPRLKRIPFAAAVALFYAFMMSPILYNSRDLSDTSSGWFATLGTVLAWTGAVFEAVADGQKMAVKFQTKNEATNAEKATFVGPTGVTYRICRHPNYFAELLYWFGLLVAGMPSFKKSIIAWTASLLGMYGIYGIMTNATKRLDKKQMETYSGQELYEAWRKQVKAPIFPFIYSDKPE